MNFQNQDDTICALSTSQGVGAISLIRLSGSKTFEIIANIFSKNLDQAVSHSAHFGLIKREDQILDEVLVTIFKNPNSFTGENMVEIGCHGSHYIVSEILKLLVEEGSRLAGPGEFSLRAFLNGKMDLSQTEAIADLIQSNSEAAHRLAMHQMRGGFSAEIGGLREELMNFAALIELELDFSEEDVEFADRAQLQALLVKIKEKVTHLVKSFKLGNAIKNGIPVAIVGAPNAGKSTLLNALLNEEKAIVSEIAGTTRDVIEDRIVIDGIEFRFIDTAGIRDTSDKIESMGIERAYQQIKSAQIVLLLFDLVEANEQVILEQITRFSEAQITSDQKLICLFNKVDEVGLTDYSKLKEKGLFISAKNKIALPELEELLIEQVKADEFASETIVSNLRHYEILKNCQVAVIKIEEGLQAQIPGDLLAMDIREVLNQLGAITGEISSDDLLGHIFGNFCIGK